MILSNEPGYYKAGSFGIRIENLVLVEAREIDGAEDDYMGFENLTWAPIDATLVDVSMLSADEVAWWNEYHAQVLEVVGPQLDGDAKVWLEGVCGVLGQA
jgi:Xaa-Pro aminopeptidase